MTEGYELFYEGNVVGYGQIKKQGLNYQIICKYQPPSEEIYCLWFVSGDRQIRLGVYVPEMALRTSEKALEKGNGHFELQKKDEEEGICFIEECPDVFVLLNNLPQLRVRKVNGKMGITIIQDQAQD